MKALTSLTAVAALVLGYALSAQAADVTAAIGQSGDSTMVYRLGSQWDWDSAWMQSDSGRLTGYWDLGYTYWDGDETASNHSVRYALPVPSKNPVTDAATPPIWSANENSDRMLAR